MTCAEAERYAAMIRESKPLGTQTCHQVADTLELHYRRMCPCYARLAEWPYAVKPAHIDYWRFDD